MNDASKPMDSNSDTTNPANPSVSKFVSPGILLFIDQLIVAAGGWIYWLVISKFTTTSEIGHATAIYSLVLLITTITQLGLEYPLLKRSSNDRSRIFGSVIGIELAITVVSIPIVLYTAYNLYEGSQQLAWLAIGIMMLSSVSFVTRFVLLGLSNARTVLVFDILGTGMKFALGFYLVSAGYGAVGILVSFLAQSLLIASGTLLAVKRALGFGIGDIKFVKEIIRDGLINMPTKLSRLFIISLSVVLLAYLGVTSSDIGIFYIAVMISVAAGSFASSLSFMVIPASSELNADLTTGSMRLGLTFTSPIVTALVVAPKSILSLIGSEYISAETVLLILSVGIVPFIVTTNAVSKFNNLGKSRRIVFIGATQLLVFLVGFFVLVPQYGTIGAALSILLAFASSAILSIAWIEQISIRHVASSTLSILAGGAVGYVISSMLGIHIIAAVSTAMALTLIVNIILRNTSVSEIAYLSRRCLR